MITLTFRKTIKRWDEAIPLGNGISGALIWGTSRGLRFSLDRGDIWDTTPCSAVSDEKYTYPMMVQLAKERKNDEIKKFFVIPIFRLFHQNFLRENLSLTLIVTAM